MPGQEVRAAMRDAVLCWCATVSSGGEPNVSSKEIFAPHGEDSLVIADIASPVTLRNLRAGSALCLSFVEIFRQKGWKFLGSGRVIGRHEKDFTAYVQELTTIAGPLFSDMPCHSYAHRPAHMNHRAGLSLPSGSFG